MIRRSLVLTGLLVLSACAPALATPTTATLRVEGSDATTFEETALTTDTRTVPVGRCQGDPDTRQVPGATALGILEDGAQAGAYTYDTNDFGPGPGDLFVCRIGPDAAPQDFSAFWLYKVNHALPDVGAGVYTLAPGDRVLWYFTGDFSARTLDLQSPSRAATGEAVQAQVTSYDSGGTGLPAAAATVAAQGPAAQSHTAGADGRATFTFDSAGSYRLKATRTGDIRSNGVEVCVYAPGSGACGMDAAGGGGGEQPAAGGQGAATQQARRDDRAPSATISSLQNGARYRRAPRVIRGTVDEDTAIHQVYLRLRMVDGDGCSWLSGKREVLTRPRTCASARFIRLGDAAAWSYQLPLELPAGARYIVDVKVLDRALNRDLEQVRFSVRP
jgi:hypothetical protein